MNMAVTGACEVGLPITPLNTIIISNTENNNMATGEKYFGAMKMTNETYFQADILQVCY